MEATKWPVNTELPMVDDIVMQDSEQQARDLLLPPSQGGRKVDFELFLEPKLSPYNFHFSVFNRHYLALTRTHKKSKHSTTTEFHLGLLNDSPEKRKHGAWFTLFGATLTAVASVLLAWFIGDYLVAAITGVLSLSLFAVYYAAFREHTLFHSRTGKVPLLTLSHRCQCKKSLHNFIVKLQDRVSINKLPKTSEFFAQENRWHRELKDQGWISEDDYQQARVRILKRFNRSKKNS